MFKPHIGDCVECPRKGVIIPVKSGLCQYCNHEKKKKNKNTNKLQGIRINQKGCSIGKKIKLSIDNKRAFSSAFQSSTKPTGEKEVFEAIAGEREWNCFVTGKPLTELKATTFAHVLPKALNKYPLFKLYKPNIQLVADEIHYAWDFKPRSELKKDRRFDKLFALEEELKQEYKLLKNKQ